MKLNLTKIKVDCLVKSLDFRLDITLYFLHQKKFKMTLVFNEICIDCLVLAQKSDKSCLFQRTMAEWPGMKKTGLRHIALVKKAISNVLILEIKGYLLISTTILISHVTSIVTIADTVYWFFQFHRKSKIQVQNCVEYP